MIRDLLADIALPKMVKVGQRFPTPEVKDVAGGAARGDSAHGDCGTREAGDARCGVAWAAGASARLPLIVRVTIEELKRLGAEPFIVPAMGSHGGATAEGQVQVLARLGVTEESAGCRIHSSMDVVELGALDNGLPVLVDRNAYEADGIVVINRVKAHDGFSGPHESGLVKMITIGLGKQKGADSAHVPGFGYMGELSLKMAEIKLAKLPFLFGVATVENANHKVAHIRAIGADKIIEGDRELLVEAKSMMPKLLLAPFDVLVVDQLGKEYSGGGMDPHTTGRTATPFVQGWSAADTAGGAGCDRAQPRQLLRRGQCRHYDTAAVQQDGPGIHVYERADVDGNQFRPRGTDYGFRQAGDSGCAEDVQRDRPEQGEGGADCQHAAHYRDVYLRIHAGRSSQAREH